MYDIGASHLQQGGYRLWRSRRIHHVNHRAISELDLEALQAARERELEEESVQLDKEIEEESRDACALSSFLPSK